MRMLGVYKALEKIATIDTSGVANARWAGRWGLRREGLPLRDGGGCCEDGGEEEREEEGGEG